MTGTTPDGTEPTGAHQYRVGATTSAAPEVVWPLIGEARRWREWSFLTRSELEREGAPDPDGVGAVRRFSRYGIGSREEVVAWDAPTHLGYRILSGFPVRNYRADVTLTPEGTGTRIDWVGTFDVKWPGSGRVLDAVLPKMMQRFADALVAFADGQAPGA
jgi:Polyketide cyclase / dehydrase and lipid transport